MLQSQNRPITHGVPQRSILGLLLFSEATWGEITQPTKFYLCKKVSQRIAVLKKIKRYLPLAERKPFFNALIKFSTDNKGAIETLVLVSVLKSRVFDGFLKQRTYF